mgnify:CR=1 FL=1
MPRRVPSRTRNPRSTNSIKSRRAVRPEMFSRSVYDRGALVLHAMRRTVGDDTSVSYTHPTLPTSDLV